MGNVSPSGRRWGRGSGRAALLWVGLLGSLVCSGGVGRAEAPGDAASSNETVVAHLQYREVDFAPLCWEPEVKPCAPFAREPVYAGRQVFRGQLMLGKTTNHWLRFAWDNLDRKLYLDLNHNGDLTDDPGGVLRAPGGGLQLFRGIRLRAASETGPYEVLADAHVFGQQQDTRVFLYVRSLWDGPVELGGRKWYLEVIDWPDGRIGPTAGLKQIGDRMTLRPWAERDRPSLWWHATLESVHSLDHVKLVNFPFRYAGNAEVFDAFNAPAGLFLEGRAYKVEYRPEPGGKLAVAFHPAHPDGGKLRLGGDHIRRVVLDGGAEGYTVVLDSPPAEVEVPAGTYPRQIVLLQRADGTNVAVGLGMRPLAITVGTSAILNAGGPLQNSVTTSPSPSSGILYFNYLLTNSAGISFRLAFEDEKGAPRLEIRQGDTLVAKGRFRFG